MSWMTQLVARMLGKSDLSTSWNGLTQRVIDRVEPEMWGMVLNRIPTGSYAEARGYVWSRSALPVEKAIHELTDGMGSGSRGRIAAASRELIADRIVKQLKMHDHSGSIRRAA